jgi:hypothetical protein
MKLHVLRSAAALALAAAASSAARAQAQPGDMVRVWAAGQGRQEGIVVAAAPDSLRLAVFRSDTVALAWTEVRRIDIGSGRESAHQAMTRGLVRGLVYGAAAGAVIGFALGDSFCQVQPTLAPGSSESAESRGCGFGGRVIGAGVGAVGGGVIGAGIMVVYGAWNPGTLWKRSRARPEVGAGAAPDGMAVAVNLRF